MSYDNAQSLEDYLKGLALTDWKKFVEVTGIDMEFLRICEMRGKGKSWGQISKTMNLDKSYIRRRCKKCVKAA